MHGQSRIIQGPHVQLPTPYAYVFGQKKTKTKKQVFFANSHSVSPIILSDLWSNRTDEYHFRGCDESRELFGRYGAQCHILSIRFGCPATRFRRVYACLDFIVWMRSLFAVQIEASRPVWLNPSCTNRLHDCFVLTINKTVMPSTRPTYQTHLSCQLLMPPLQTTPTYLPLQSFRTRKLWKDVRIEFSPSEILLNHYWKASITITIEWLWKER